MSGGPTFDEDGNLLGVNSEYYLENNNSFFVPNTAIKQFLD
jgi:S1-C subfamily serine protease